MSDSNATKIAGRKERSSETRERAPAKPIIVGAPHDSPAAGAHAARHLVNEEATPGAGALPSHAHHGGREVDGGAG